jgi:hypothetical protein
MLWPADEPDRRTLKIVILVASLTLLLSGCTQESQPPAATPPAKSVGWKGDGLISEGEYPKHKNFGKLEVFWKTDGEFLYMALKGQTKGWVAIGFEPSSSMKDADMVIAWVENGEVKAVDAFSTGLFGPHPPDEELGGKYDLTEIGGREENGITVIEFKRKLDTGDEYDKVLKKGEVTRIIWALANGDSFSLRHNVARGDGEIVI